MTWDNTQPYQGKRKEARRCAPAVSMAIVRRPGPTRGDAPPVLSVTVKPEKIAGGLAWWQDKQDISIGVGNAEHAGQLRIVPGGLNRISRRGGHPNAPLTAQLLVPSGMDAVLRDAVPVFYTVSDGALLVTLPAEWGSLSGQQAA
jgi:hypothetical protein